VSCREVTNPKANRRDQRTLADFTLPILGHAPGTAGCPELIAIAVSRFCFEYRDVPNHSSIVSNRVYADQDEACCLKKYSPFSLATLFTAGDSKHVQVAHQVAIAISTSPSFVVTLPMPILDWAM
jgi:hypothetical protein